MPKQTKPCIYCGANAQNEQCGVCSERARRGKPPRTSQEREEAETRSQQRDEKWQSYQNYRSKAQPQAFSLFGPKENDRQLAFDFLLTSPSSEIDPPSKIAIQFYKAENGYIHSWLGSTDKTFLLHWIKDHNLAISPNWITEIVPTDLPHTTPLFIVDSYGKNVKLVEQALKTSKITQHTSPATLQSVTALLNEPKRAYAASRSKLAYEYRDELFERDGQQCVVCAATKELEMAHLIPRAKGLQVRLTLEQLDNLQNLITLCRACHTAFDERFIHSGNQALNAQIKQLSQKVINFYQYAVLPEFIERLMQEEIAVRKVEADILVDGLLSEDVIEFYEEIGQMFNDTKLVEAQGFSPLMVFVVDTWLIFDEINPENLQGRKVFLLAERVWDELLSKHEAQYTNLKGELRMLSQERNTERTSRKEKVVAALRPRQIALLQIWGRL